MQADVERLLARLLTDREFRERFLVEPAEVAKKEGLSPEEVEAVARMPGQDLRTAARSYEHKRNAGIRQRRDNWWSSWFRSGRS